MIIKTELMNKSSFGTHATGPSNSGTKANVFKPLSFFLWVQPVTQSAVAGVMALVVSKSNIHPSFAAPISTLSLLLSQMARVASLLKSLYSPVWETLGFIETNTY